MKKFWPPILLTVVVAVILVALITRDFTPALAAYEGARVDAFLRMLFAISAAIFALVMVFLFYSLAVFRRKPGDDTDGPPIRENLRLEIVWTVIPLIIVLVLAFLGIDLLRDMTEAKEGELEVKVVGFQYSWTFEYPEQGIISPELMLPVDRPVVFKLYSNDVIHSFYIPEFRIKMDTIPGQENVLRITPSQVGEYKVRCAELCGAGHSYMLAPVSVVEQSTFQQWLQEQKAAANDGSLSTQAKAGKQASQETGCIACHSTDGAPLVGPTWLGLFGRESALTDGSTVVADETYLSNSILEPGSQIVEGFADLMPKDYGNRLSEAQIQDIIAYIKSLQ